MIYSTLLTEFTPPPPRARVHRYALPARVERARALREKAIRRIQVLAVGSVSVAGLLCLAASLAVGGSNG